MYHGYETSHRHIVAKYLLCCQSICNICAHNLQINKMGNLTCAAPEENYHTISKIPQLLSNSSYKLHLCRQDNHWSLRCSWSRACRCCSNYIVILDLNPGFNGLGKDDYKTRRESFKFWDYVRLLLDILRNMRFMYRQLNSLRPSDAYMRQYTNHHWFR